MVDNPEAEAIKRQVFKIHSFDTFPLDELHKISEALKVLGYEGCFVDNGNIVFIKVEEVEQDGQGTGTEES